MYDGTLDDADTTFAMLVGYLKALGGQAAKELVLIGDGAKWIWERAGQMAEELGIPTDRVTEIIDWYHATERLAEVANTPSRWSDKARKKWLRRAKDALHGGDIEAVMALFDELAVGRRAASVNEHRAYFQRNAARMQYAAFKAARQPLGSGAVESAVRMIVNMRLKSTGRFWLRENAQSMLMLRSYLKSDRFDDLVDWSNAIAAAWWSPGLEDAPGASPPR